MDPWSLPLTQLSGVGEERAKDFAQLGVESIGALFYYFPIRYEDFRLRDLTEIQHGEKATIRATIYGLPTVQYYGRKKSRLTCRLVSGPHVVTAVWFNRPYVKEQLVPGKEITITGTWDMHRLQVNVEKHRFATPKADQALEPVYRVTGSLSQTFLRKIIRQSFQQYGAHLEEILPASLLLKYRLASRWDALRWMHFPQDLRQGSWARRRLAYEELFLFQLKMQAFRMKQRRELGGITQVFPQDQVEQFIERLPFTLTGAQQRVVVEILKDMASPFQMNRLLQGDVGSGKTLVAAIALYASVLAGYQGALMVPTEILANQHLQSLQELLAPYDIEVVLLTGSLPSRQRRDILAQIQLGFAQVVVGTHALIQEDVTFQRLGLVITDEQHRFGVEQRRILRAKGWLPDTLFMTATPIPRTMAITAFGDMDISRIDEMPAGRKEVETYWVKPQLLERILRFVAKEVAKGHQAYVIAPLIEESDKLDVQNVLDLYQTITQYLPHLTVDIMHGRLKNEEQDRVMEEFTAGRTQVLVSTTVVEVGVNVPNATVMVIYDADRFGLAQLHQLRGRVGRGDDQSYCILIADPKGEVGKERMRIMAEIQDGFILAEKDLELRGPGDYFGKKQSGLPDFLVADLSRDTTMLEYARGDVEQFVRQEQFWQGQLELQLLQWLERKGIFSEQLLD